MSANQQFDSLLQVFIIQKNTKLRIRKQRFPNGGPRTTAGPTFRLPLTVNWSLTLRCRFQRFCTAVTKSRHCTRPHIIPFTPQPISLTPIFILVYNFLGLPRAFPPKFCTHSRLPHPSHILSPSQTLSTSNSTW
jgi:hypothetical protein